MIRICGALIVTLWLATPVFAQPSIPTDSSPGSRLQKVEGGPMRILICGSLYLAGHVLALQEGVQAQTN